MVSGSDDGTAKASENAGSHDGMLVPLASEHNGVASFCCRERASWRHRCGICV